MSTLNILTSEKPIGHVATFYMRGGHKIVVDNVETVELTHDISTGSYIEYKITWLQADKAPALFSLSIPDIVAVQVD